MELELSELQKSIINAPYNKCVIIASSASGKTQTMTEKTRQILRAGYDPRKIAVITYTNMAATELKQRLAEDYKEGIYIGTVHGLANYMLRSSGVETSSILDDEKFDELFKLVVENPYCIQKLEWILLDEAQDTDPSQFRFLFRMIDPPNFFVVMDPKQCIYQFRGSNPTLINELTWRSGVKVFELNENYRNGADILNFAKEIIKPTGLFDSSIPMRGAQGKVIKTTYSTEYIVDKLLYEENLRDWAILTRTNVELREVGEVLKANNIPFESFKQGDLSKEELLKKMDSNNVKLLTIHSSKGLEWKNVIVIGARYYSNDELNVCYVAATRARDQLIWMRKPKKGWRQYKK